MINNKTLKFIFISPCATEEFFLPVKKGMHDAAALMNAECEFVGTEDVDIAEQICLVKKAVDDGYDGIALSLPDSTTFNDVVAEAMAEGIPVVAFNIDNNDSGNGRLSACCQKLYEAGRTLGGTAADSIHEGSRILMTVHSEGISALEDRLNGALEILKSKNVTYEVVVTGTEPLKAKKIITGILKENSDIKTILCTGQADTEGAGLAIEQNFADEGYYTAGFDVSDKILRLVKNNIIAFTIDQQPYMQGFFPVIQLVLYCRYGIMPSDIDAGAGLITVENVDNVIELSKKGYR